MRYNTPSWCILWCISRFYYWRNLCKGTERSFEELTSSVGEFMQHEMYTTFSSEDLRGRKHSEKPRRRWEENIRMNLREIGWEISDWMHPTQER
jgi:hypothetical protein